MDKEELKIREAVEKAPAPQPPKGLRNEFMSFLSQYKVLRLAVAFVLDLYLGAIVRASAVLAYKKPGDAY